ncbi:protein 5NUC-like [Ixodes scapularis]|uniref:protein 5NUC-like n=1 Tax=Ixodes scapularis TaxID=6945 RepID=UPI001A9F8C21|nr:protein 5NUC-like [Ixodes scapularis]
MGFCFAVFLALWGAALSKSDKGFNITVLHTNDIHSHFLQSNKRGGSCTEKDLNKSACYGGVARIITKVKELKGKVPNPLFFNGGDFFQGTIWYTVLKYNIVALAMENMMYDAVCLGNHEFDDGPEGLAPFLLRMMAANVTVLGTNLDTTKEDIFIQKNITVLKHKIYEFNGVKMAVMGVVTKETLTIARPGKINIFDEIESIKNEIESIKKETKKLKTDVKIFALISHVGYEKDMEIAKEVKDLHFIVGGHTNTFLYSGQSPGDDTPAGPYPTVVKRDDGSIALVTQDYCFGKYLGFLELQFDATGKLKNWSGNPILMDYTIEEDKAMLTKLKPYEEIVRKAGDEPIGTSKVLLEASHKICRLKECNMVNLIADSFLAYYADRNSTIPGAWSDVNAAVVNAGITRTSIQQGTVLRKHVMEAMPFESSLVVLTMNGNQLQKMFDDGISKFTWYGDPEGSFLQVSGMRVVYNFLRHQHNRTEKLKILCANCSVPKYELVEPTVTYKIVTTSFMARGGDGFIFEKEVLDSMKTEGLMDVEVFTDYLRKLSPIKTPEEGRIKMHNNRRPSNATSGGLYPGTLKI